MNLFKSKKKQKKIMSILLFFYFLILFCPSSVLAQADLGINEAANIGLPSPETTDIRMLLVDIIRYFLSFLGIIAVIIIIYAGWLWMTSDGNLQKLEKAKKTLINAIIGLIIIIASFAIVTLVANFITNTILNQNNNNSSNIQNSGMGLGASGNSAIESHYPARNQADVSRSTWILITFRESINVDDIINPATQRINTENIKIYRSDLGEDGVSDADLFTPFMFATTTPDHRIFRFSQEGPNYLGSPTEDTWYTVELVGTNIHKENGDNLFTLGGYSWQFQVSTEIDNTPPKIKSIIPKPSLDLGARQPRNVVIQINFNEPIDPISASGPAAGLPTIQVFNANTHLTNGNFYISNQYSTVEFLTTDSCGNNTCGDPIFCLPGNGEIRTRIYAARLADLNSGSPKADINFLDGVVDTSGNSLDGNGNNTAQGPSSQAIGNPPAYDANNPSASPTSDDYTWLFYTSDAIDTTAPVISSIGPGYTNSSNILLDAEIYTNFSKLLMSSSLIKDNIDLLADNSNNEVFYWIENMADTNANTTRVDIKHRTFAQSAGYAPILKSKIKDIYQNCFWPSAGPGQSAGICAPDANNHFCCNGLGASVCAP